MMNKMRRSLHRQHLEKFGMIKFLFLNKKIICSALLVCVCFLFYTGIKKIYHHQVEGFSLKEIRTAWKFDPFLLAPLSPDELCHFQAIFKEPFTYLGKGTQSYVFESQDHQYVLKFFKQKHFQKKDFFLLKFAPLSIQNTYAEKSQKRKERIHAIFESCLLGFQSIPKETGILYINLNKNFPLEHPVTLIDKIGVKWKVNLTNYEFILQKKGLPLDQYLLEIQKNPEKIDLLLNQIAQCIETRCQKKIMDLDDSVAQNMAITLDLKDLFFTDVGFFTFDETLDQPQKIADEIQKRFLSLKKWSEEFCPAITPIIEKRIM